MEPSAKHPQKSRQSRSLGGGGHEGGDGRGGALVGIGGPHVEGHRGDLERPPGWVMAHVDVAGAIPAMRRAGGRVATVSVNSFQFKQAISVGDLVSLYADIVHVGNTSITVNVEVYAERNYANPVTVKVTEAQLTYVAIDGNGKKRAVEPENT